MAQTKIKAGLFEGIIGNGTDGYFLMSNGDGTMTWSSIIINPTIASIAYPGSATAADPAGGETITVTGADFKTGATVTVGGTSAPAVSYVSGTQITFTTPAKSAGDYDIVVTNTDTGSATYINGISYNGIPSWTTAAGSLGTFASGATISTITLQASEPDAGTITFNITNGSLPTGLSLTGANIDGTTSLLNADTLYTFTVTATDDENQTTPRTFTITVKKQIVSTDHFNAVLYTGNGGTQSITGVGFQPDLVWVKSRSATNSHVLVDVVRGVKKALFSDLTNAELASSGNNFIYAFGSDGFSVGGADYAVNNNGQNFVGWCWKAASSDSTNTDGSITSTVRANQDAGFSIVKYTGNLTASTVGHGLSSAPELIIVKRTDNTSNWFVYSEPTGNTKYLNLDSTGAASTFNVWNNTSPTSTVFSLAAQGDVNASGGTYITYCFHSVSGYQKIGSFSYSVGYSENVGFEPRFLLMKKTSSTGSWYMIDNKRVSGSNNYGILANSAAAEDTGTDYITFTSTGFTTTYSDSGTYIYLAIA